MTPNILQNLNLLNQSDFDALMRQLGVSGSNPARPLDRRSQVLQGILALMQGQNAVGLEPLRQGTLNAFLQNINPANTQARVDAASRANRSQAAQNAAQMAAIAPMLGITPASLASYYANADRNTARFGQQARSNQGLGESYNAMLNAIGGAQNPQFAQLLSGLQGNMQQSNTAKTPKQNPFGQLLGTVGQLYGMGAFGGGGSNLMGMSANALAGRY